MADKDIENDDRTEDATPERREDFREQGQIALSKELTQVAVLASTVILVSVLAGKLSEKLQKIMVTIFQQIGDKNLMQNFTSHRFLGIFQNYWVDMVVLLAPIFILISVVSIFITFLQSQFNWSWKRLTFDVSKMNPLQGLKRMISAEAIVELLKSIAKMIAVTGIAYLVLKGEWKVVPGLLNVPFSKSWEHYTDLTTQLFWGVSALLVVIGGADYLFNFVSIEKKMRMTKQEIKEEVKQRETDPHVKAKLKRMAREILNRKTVEKTKAATVIITNPTHFSIAIKYEVGMSAPVVLAKGIDFLALRMREIAKQNDIPMVENRPLARSLYDEVKEGEEIPSSMYKAVSEIIKYIFQVKGIKIPSRS